MSKKDKKMIDLKTLDALSAYNKINNLTGNFPADEAEKTSGANFTSLVEEALGKTVNNIKVAEEKTKGMLAGDVSMEDLALAVANAEMSLKTVVSIRDRLVSAFQDIIRMPI